MRIFIRFFCCSFLLILLNSISSCAFVNSETVQLAINSNPSGADILIEDINYGKTPAVIDIKPKNYMITLLKEGYGTATFSAESWATIRTDVNGKNTADGNRCLLDTMSVLFFFNTFSDKCADFKQKSYLVNIPRSNSSRTIDYRDSINPDYQSTSTNKVDDYYSKDVLEAMPGAMNKNNLKERLNNREEMNYNSSEINGYINPYQIR